MEKWMEDIIDALTELKQSLLASDMPKYAHTVNLVITNLMQESNRLEKLVIQNLPSQNDLLAEIIKLREYTAKHINIFGDSPIGRIYDKLFELEQKFSKQTA